MNIYYLVRNNISNKNDTGFFKKFRGQINVFLKHGDVIFIYKDRNRFYAEFNHKEQGAIYNKAISGKSLLTHFLYYYNIAKLFYLTPPSVIYMRYKISEPTFILFLYYIKKKYPHCKIFIEYPTFPYDPNWSDESLIKKISLPVDKIFRTQLHRFADYAVNYTETESIYKIKTICIKNGIDVDDIQIKKTSYREKQIRLIGVAGLGYWHGYDRIIKGIKDYYDNKKNAPLHDISFIIVGDGREKENLISLTHKLKLDDKIIFTGTKTGLELDELFDSCDIAVSAIGIHRMGVYTHSALKNREYCARGIPFINAGEDIDFENKFKYKIEVPLNDTPVNINQIINFHHTLKMNKVKSEEMRKYAHKNLSWETQMLKIIEKI